MQSQQDNVYQQGCTAALNDCNDGCLAADAFQLWDAEFVTDVESDEAQCDVTEDGKFFDIGRAEET